MNDTTEITEPDEPDQVDGDIERDAKREQAAEVVAAVLRETGAESANHDTDTLARRIVHALAEPSTVDTSTIRPTDEHGNAVEQ